MNFIIYEKTTGEILISGEAAEVETIVCADNEELIIVDYPINNIYRNSGNWINLETKEIINFGEKPLGAFTLNANGWVKDIEQEKICAAQEARNERNQLLIDSDWTDALSAKSRLGETLFQQWQDYRQALRDMPEQSGFPLAIVWPTKPE
jgi:hypothetical protein